ncbi:MAG TPA: metallophosphoesterase [Eubacteriaceae bacterium]|nr:metallophosphoesterase [Eubacteriaceae bacterium]
MKKRGIFFSGVLITFVLLAKIYYDTNVFKVKEVEFQSSKLPEDTQVTIVQISDLHSKDFGDQYKKLVESIEDLQADLIVITGDLIDRKTTDFAGVFSFIEKVAESNEKIYFVCGNHEWENTHTEELLEGLEERNVILLNNENRELTINRVTMNVAGVDDGFLNKEDVKKAFHGLDQARYTLLLSHTPNIVYQDVPADLILSGHTHGGQVRFPFIGALLAPDQGFFPELDKGIYKMDDHQTLYIDSGLGTSIGPIRFLNQSQFSVIKIEHP